MTCRASCYLKRFLACAAMVSEGFTPRFALTAARAMALWPNKGDPDPRPPLGSAYRRLDPVMPDHPVVPADAPGGLRISH